MFSTGSVELQPIGLHWTPLPEGDLVTSCFSNEFARLPALLRCLLEARKNVDPGLFRSPDPGNCLEESGFVTCFPKGTGFLKQFHYVFPGLRDSSVSCYVASSPRTSLDTKELFPGGSIFFQVLIRGSIPAPSTRIEPTATHTLSKRCAN